MGNCSFCSYLITITWGLAIYLLSKSCKSAHSNIANDDDDDDASDNDK